MNDINRKMGAAARKNVLDALDETGAPYHLAFGRAGCDCAECLEWKASLKADDGKKPEWFDSAVESIGSEEPYDLNSEGQKLRSSLLYAVHLEQQERLCGEWRIDPNKFYERKEDMSPDGKLRIMAQDDGDVIVCVIPDSEMEDPSASVEFCTSPIRSPNVLKALRNLARAIELDNEEGR